VKYTTPIADRIRADVDNRTPKGFINVVDWLRIYDNSQFANALVKALSGADVSFTLVARPDVFTIPDVKDLNAILANIERVRKAARMPDGVANNVEISALFQAGATKLAPTYDDVNVWELVIDAIVKAMRRGTEYRAYPGLCDPGLPFDHQTQWIGFQSWVKPSLTPVRRARCGLTVCGAGIMRNNGFRRY